MTKKLNLLLLLFLFFTVNNLTAQEVAPLKTFHYEVSLNQLKTESQAQAIKSQVSKISGVQNCELVLIEYNLSFTCTNHDMTRYQIMDEVKVAIVSNGSEIVNIQRTEDNEK